MYAEINTQELNSMLSVSEERNNNMPKENENPELSEVSQNSEELSAKDKLRDMLDNGIRGVLNSEQFKNWLSTTGKYFTQHYSFRNAMLIYLQKPEASHVMGYEQWKEYGRNVAQGSKGASIIIPVMASEKEKGGLFRAINSNLNGQFSKDTNLTQAVYRLGQGNIEFTLNKANHLYGLRVDGKERTIFNSAEEVKKYIDRAILGKIPVFYNAGTVFDAKDVITPEFLWLKKGFDKKDVVTGENGKPITNKRGETKIVNTPERIARFQPDIDTSITAKDPIKMTVLYDACVSMSEKKGVPVILKDKASDETLSGGAKGYFDRKGDETHPNGFIVLDNSLEITEKTAVLFHEMGHADLHKNLESLAKQMGEEKITKSMREIQAESVSFATAKAFGIETDASSFDYLAAYANGFEIQDLQKSLEVIFKESQHLIADISAELDVRGYNIDLTAKPIEPLTLETIQTLCAKYVDFATSKDTGVSFVINGLPELAKQNASNAEIIDLLKAEKQSLNGQQEDIALILKSVMELKNAVTIEAQNTIISVIESAQARIKQYDNTIDSLSLSLTTLLNERDIGLKVEFDKDSRNTLENMKTNFPRLATLSSAQIEYISTSKFIAQEYGKHLRNDPQEFVNKSCDRAEAISKYAAKNGTFVEINTCEQWTDKPVFEAGTLCHPKIAENIIAQAEVQIRGLKSLEEMKGEYLPSTNCNITIYTPTGVNSSLSAFNTSISIGDGTQSGLKNFLTEKCDISSKSVAGQVIANFEAATTEKGAYKNKIFLPSSQQDTEAQNAEKATEDKGKTMAEWKNEITKVKEESVTEANDKEKTKKDPNRE